MNADAAALKQGRKKKTRLTAMAAASILAMAGCVVWLFAGRFLASTARLIRYEGTVQLSGEDGAEKTIVKSMRFQSGSALRTESASLVAIGLDEAKIVTMNENSAAEFVKSGKRIRLHLTRGRLFFQVAKALKDDESFDIRTSTMVVGIRGTSGYVSVDEDGHERLYVTDGVVHVVGTNPVTGEVKEIDVRAGERITVYLFNDREQDSIVFFLEYPEEDWLPSLIPTLLRADPALRDKVCAETGWDPEKLEALAVAYDAQGSDRGVDVHPAGEAAFRPVASRVTLMAQSASKVYDGTPLTRPDDIKIVGLPDGFAVHTAVEGSQTETGTSPNRITDWEIRDPEGVDRTAYFLDVILVDGQLTVIPMPLTVITPDAEKVYDGTPLTREEYAIRGAGMETEEGLWLNTGYVITDENGYKAVYVLDGSLHMVGANPLTREVLTEEISAGQKVTVRLAGEGEEDTIQYRKEPVTEKELPEEILRLLASDPGLLDRACADAHWDGAVIEELAAKLDGQSAAPIDPEPPETEEGAGEPAEEAPPAVPGAEPDSLLHDEEVRKHLVEENAAWKLMVDTDADEFRGRDLYAAEADLTRPTAQEGPLPRVRVTGSQTQVGSSPNSFVVEWEPGEEKNYTVVEKPGTLTVMPLTIIIRTGSAEKPYDGTPLKSEEASAEGVEGVTVTATGSQTDAGSVENTYTVDWGAVDPDNYEIKEELGTLTVTPATLTVTTGSAQKAYDGIPLASAAVQVTGLAAGENVTVRTTGSRTDAGSSKNTYTIDWGGTDPDNYTVEEKLGILTVTRAAVTVTTGDGNKPYDGTALTNATATLTGAPAGVTVTATGSQTDAGSSKNTYAINWNGVNAANYAVTENLGTLIVTPLSFTVTTASASKVYDATALTDAAATLTGAPAGVTATATGSRTDAGSSPNTYTINWAGNNPANYTITENLGSLTVTPKAATVFTGSTSELFNLGGPLTNTYAFIDGVIEPGVTVTATGQQDGPGSSLNTCVINWNGVNPNNYAITYNLGTLEYYQ